MGKDARGYSLRGRNGFFCSVIIIQFQFIAGHPHFDIVDAFLHGLYKFTNYHYHWLWLLVDHPDNLPLGMWRHTPLTSYGLPRIVGPDLANHSYHCTIHNYAQIGASRKFRYKPMYPVAYM